MGKKVLIISGSPRKGGNSDLLCDQFLLGAKEAGNQTEKIFLRDKKIGYCTGCGSCYISHKCVQKDDMAEILEKMIIADSSKQAMERTLEGFRGFTSCLSGAKEKGILYGTGAWNMAWLLKCKEAGIKADE